MAADTYFAGLRPGRFRASLRHSTYVLPRIVRIPALELDTPMPMTQSARASPGPELDRFRKPPPPVVFVVEHDEAVLDSSVAVLEGHGFKVRAFSSCEEFLGERPPPAGDLLLLDAHIPGMSGLDLHGAYLRAHDTRDAGRDHAKARRDCHARQAAQVADSARPDPLGAPGRRSPERQAVAGRVATEGQAADGNTTRTISPPPSRSRRVTSPPCPRTMVRAVERPSPMPPVSRLREPSTR